MVIVEFICYFEVYIQKTNFKINCASIILEQDSQFYQINLLQLTNIKNFYIFFQKQLTSIRIFMCSLTYISRFDQVVVTWKNFYRLELIFIYTRDWCIVKIMHYRLSFLLCYFKNVINYINDMSLCPVVGKFVLEVTRLFCLYFCL